MTAWIITDDLIADEEDKAAHPEGKSNHYAVGLIGPSIATTNDEARLRDGEGLKFRLLDDDQIVYYIGRRLEESECTYDYEGGSYGYRESDLAPLENFGTPNAGCVQIEYYNDETKKWEGLL